MRSELTNKQNSTLVSPDMTAAFFINAQMCIASGNIASKRSESRGLVR